MKFSREEFVIDGPLIDHEMKRVAVNLDGVDELEGHKAYRLSIKLPSGAPRRVWIDAETFLDIKHDRPSSNPLAIGKSAAMTESVVIRIGLSRVGPASSSAALRS